jgi:hypothetical protein
MAALDNIRDRLMAQLPAVAMVIAGALLLCWPAFWNGFPLMYSDTGAYLATAFEGKVPMARPTGYGLFIRYAAMGQHIWWPLLVQGLLCALLLWRTVRVVLPDVAAWKAFPLSFVGAFMLTGLPWYASQLMPDVFTGLVALTFFLLLFDQQTNVWGRWGYAFLAYIFCFSHYSHAAMLLILSGIAGLVWALQWLRKRKPSFGLGRIALAALPALMAIFSFYYVNYQNDLGWRMTRSAHVFTMARLSETGILQAYLHETCPTQPWSLCPYADALPSTAADFIWREDSPFKQTGYWEGSRPGYDSLLADFFSRPHYQKLYAQAAMRSGFAQLFELSVGEGLTPYNENSSPYKFFARAMPAQVPNYLASVQFDRLFDFSGDIWVMKATMLFSVILLLVAWVVVGRKLPTQLHWFVSLALGSYVLNAILTGALANVYARLQARIAWIIPLACILVLLELWQKRRLR